MIRTYVAGDALALLSIWNGAGSRFGYAPLAENEFREIFLEHPNFSPDGIGTQTHYPFPRKHE